MGAQNARQPESKASSESLLSRTAPDTWSIEGIMSYKEVPVDQQLLGGRPWTSL